MPEVTPEMLEAAREIIGDGSGLHELSDIDGEMTKVFRAMYEAMLGLPRHEALEQCPGNIRIERRDVRSLVLFLE